MQCIKFIKEMNALKINKNLRVWANLLRKSITLVFYTKKLTKLALAIEYNNKIIAIINWCLSTVNNDRKWCIHRNWQKYQLMLKHLQLFLKHSNRLRKAACRMHCIMKIKYFSLWYWNQMFDNVHCI